MTAPTHIVSGLAAAVAIGRLTGITPTAVELLVLVVGTLAPDIDGHGSITKPGIILRRLIGRSLANLLDAIFGIVSTAVRVCFGHRGFIHSPVLVVLLLALGTAVEADWITWFAIGYAVHLLGDTATAGGIPLRSPFSTHRTSFSSMRTGSKTEAAVCVLLLVFVCGAGWSLLPKEVKHTHWRIVEALWGV